MITTAYYKGCKGAFVVYDITRKDTFNSVEKWVYDLKTLGDPNLNLILIGNKCDLENERDILKEQGEEKAKSFGCAFLETSAFSGENIEKAFEMMVEEIYKKFRNDILEDDELVTIDKGDDLSKENNDKTNKKGCC